MSEFLTDYIFPIFVSIFLLFVSIALIFVGINLVSKNNECNYVNEDVNRDGEVTIKDLLLVQKYILEKDNNG